MLSGLLSLTSSLSLREYRKRAYQFILEQTQAVNADLPASKTNRDAQITLEELEGLKLGLADPSPTLIENCRRIFGQYVDVSAFEGILVTPFSIGNQANR